MEWARWTNIEIIVLRIEENMKKYPNINAYLCWKIVFMGSMCFCFNSFKTRWVKYSEAGDTENSFLSSGIDGMNITTLSCRSCIPESLKKSGDSRGCDKVHRKPSQGSPHSARCVVPAKCQCSETHPGEPACQLPSSLHYLKQIFKVS